MLEVPAEIIICTAQADYARLGAEWIAHRAQQAVQEHGVFTVAFSGGTAPIPVLDQLARPEYRACVPWPVTLVYWCDERCVPPDDPDSNYRLVREHLLEHVAIPPEHIHRIEGEQADPDIAARCYDEALPGRLDLLILGIGEDGHTASLFPGSPLLLERTRRVAVETDSPKPPPCRITITPPVVEAARHLLVLATGSAKATAVARALAAAYPIEDVPARLARRGTWLLDHAAAAELPDELHRLLTE